MREMRSGSQILFGHLPEQTVDADGGIWKVRNWNDAKIETAVDPSALREELIRAAYPWSDTKEDDGFVDDLHKQRTVKVKSLNRDSGIWCELFPRLWMCTCKRLHDERSSPCPCGTKRPRGQLPFVGYHDVCGSIKTPYVKKCPQHGQRAVRLPGTASATELLFYCPVCSITLQRGFGAACGCAAGGALKFTVHRSGTVFKPRGVVLINPPKREILHQVESAGGGERALEWLLDGMVERRVTDAAPSTTPDSIRRMLAERGFDESTISAMVAAMPVQAQTQRAPTSVRPRVRVSAEAQARQIALATFESRRGLGDLRKAAAGATLTTMYEEAYPRALRRAGLERVELIDRFPVLTAQFGYTRGDATPGASRLRTYREANGDYTVYGELAETEALFLRLDPLMVHRWFSLQGYSLPAATDARTAAIAVLENLDPPAVDDPLAADAATRLLTTLVHSFSHAFIRRAAVFAGIERSALSELVLPHAFGFFVYAAARGDFVLGGLQALLESELHLLLNGLVDDEHRCALDPGCADNGSACAVCLHLGEPSCRMFNTSLSREVLAGGSGYFDVTDASG